LLSKALNFNYTIPCIERIILGAPPSIQLDNQRAANAARLFYPLNLPLYHCPFPFSKMALNGEQSPDFNNENKPSILLDNKLDNGSGDVEKGKNPYGHSTSDKGVGGRIAPVLPHLGNYDFGSDDSGSDILGKQIEMEASAAIQYRTCSWQKVP
jgi:hypothetical protein